MLNQLERVLKALADKNRLRIVKMLRKGPMCVCEIREVLGLAQPGSLSHIDLNLPGSGPRRSGLTGEDQVAKSLLKLISSRANDDPIIIKDRSIAGKADRRKICLQKR